MLFNMIESIGLVTMAGVLFLLRWPGHLTSGVSVESAQRHHLLVRLCSVTAGLYLVSILATFYTDGISMSWSFAEIFNVVLVPMFCVYSFRNEGDNPGKSTIWLLVSLLIIITFHSLGSHAATQPGLIPLISQITHLFAVSILTGLVLLAIISYQTGVTGEVSPYQTGPSGFASNIAGPAVILLVIIILSGSILAVTNVHSTAVLDGTRYGQLLILKTSLVVFLTLLLLLDLMWKFPSAHVEGVSHSTADRSRRFWFKGVVAILILFNISLGGMLTSMESPDTAPFLNPQRWKLNADSYEINVDMQPVAGSTNHIRFEVYLPETLVQSSSTQVGFDLYMPGSKTGVFNAEALQVSANSYQGEAMFPGPGDWRLELNILRPGQASLESSVDFNIPAQPLVRDLRTYLSLSAITYNKANQLTFLVGLVLLIIYTLIIVYSSKTAISRWTAIIAISGVGLGIYMMMSVTLVKTYPSTYWKNPVAYTASDIRSGQMNYMNYCADCHGQNGRGDGPWSIENRGVIPDLGSPHMDVHTDGEIYWWITHGIPSLEMPALSEEIPEADRWSIIQFVRSLRHGIPPDN